MAAIQNRIVLQEQNSTTYNFTGNKVISVEPAESVDIMANKLAIDVAEITVEYTRGTGPDIRALPYGTPAWHYIGNQLQRKYYIKSIDRITEKRYVIHAISAVGILDNQYHKGGVYTGTLFSSLITELIGGAVPFTYDTDVGSTKIFGWLPYAKKRDNLHQILFAENISIIKNASGDMHFTFLRAGTPEEIDGGRIFMGASVNYPSVATQIEVTEHSFQYVDTIEPVTLIDNSDGSPASNKLFVFDNAPVYIASLVASGLTVEEAGVNYAIVSGQGTLTGIPYFDKKSIVSRTRSSGGASNTVAVSDITLITGVNSENVADRMLSYYTSRETIQADVKLNGEKVGGIYTFIDKFGDTVQAYLAKITAKISAIIRANCEFIAGYVPEHFGNNYDYWAYVTGNGTIEIQEGTKLARFVIIGGGDGGSSGLKGIDDFNDLQAGSVGGEGGFGGNGGKIREVVLRNPTPGVYTCAVGAGGTGGAQTNNPQTCPSTQTREQGGDGGASTVTTPGGTVYSSADNAAYRSANGIKNLFTEAVYAVKGRNGCKGGNGGRGSVAGNGEPGEDIVWDGITYKGGLGGKGYKFKFTHVDQSIANGGAGGSGAMPYQNGGDGGSVSIEDYWDETSSKSGYQAYETVSFNQGAPAATAFPSTVVQTQNFGDGGDGGHGGAGRGGFGSANELYQTSYNDPTTNKKTYLKAETEPYIPEAFESADGGAGNNGKKGIILCYADKELFF